MSEIVGSGIGAYAGRIDPDTGEIIPDHASYGNYPGVVSDYTLGVSETFAGVEPGNINFKFPLRAYRHGFFESNTTTAAAIKETLKILILTSKGERVINPDIGTDLPTLAGQLFENINIEEMQMLIETDIRGAVQKWMPFINVRSIIVKSSTEDSSLATNQIRVSMSYSIAASEVQETIGFTISGDMPGWAI